MGFPLNVATYSPFVISLWAYFSVRRYSADLACVYPSFSTLQRVQVLLRNGRSISKYTRTISRQRLGKNFPAATNTHATIEVLL
jgi:hypothetical protein